MLHKEVSLYEKCKIAVWMEQFQCAEIVQLRYKKEFTKDFPDLDLIKEIHHLFMTTGSVLESPTYVQDVKCRNERKLVNNSKANLVSAEDENCGDNRNELQNEVKQEDDDEDGDDDDDVGEELVKEEEEWDDEGTGDKSPYSLEKVPYGKNEQDFVSILNEEIAVEDQDFAEISVNECKDELGDFIGFQTETFSCIHCGYKTTNKTTFKAHQKAHRVKDFFRCSLCTFTSNSTNSFRSHKRSCTGNNMTQSKDIGNKLDVLADSNCLTCDQCGKAYCSIASLKMHQAYHSKLRPFACQKCDYRFFSEATLKKHMLTHDKIKHLECPHCSFKCSMSGNMIIHARTHTGEKPYKCNECDYRTANPNVYRRHMASHRKELIYRCRQCNYRSDKSSLLANHEKRHANELKFQCHICQEHFRTSYALRYHLTKNHSEQEMLECPFCDYRQRNKALLMIHIRRHTGEKPYGCPKKNCDYRAIRSQDMKKHLAKVHE